MKKIKEIKKIKKLNLREFCIKHNLYTRGNNEEYEKMLELAENKYTDKLIIIYKIAYDIVIHSNLKEYGQTENENIETIMFMLNKEVVETYYEIIEE